jgi:hypothetical protein
LEIPCSVAQGIRLEAIESARGSDPKIAVQGRILQNSLLISLLAGNFGAETGSQLTASSASVFFDLLVT